MPVQFAKSPPPPPKPNPESEPTLAKKIEHYTWSTIEWLYRNTPTRSQEEIDALLNICQGDSNETKCKYFHHDGKKAHCSHCGCNVTKARNGWLNKLARTNESCPINKW